MHLVLGGGIQNLTDAVDLCVVATAARGGSTDKGWLLVSSRQRQVDASRVRFLDEQEKAGIVPVQTKEGRRHAAKNPRRVHPLRFKLN